MHNDGSMSKEPKSQPKELPIAKAETKQITQITYFLELRL